MRVLVGGLSLVGGLAAGTGLWAAGLGVSTECESCDEAVRNENESQGGMGRSAAALHVGTGGGGGVCDHVSEQ